MDRRRSGPVADPRLASDSRKDGPDAAALPVSAGGEVQRHGKYRRRWKLRLCVALSAGLREDSENSENIAPCMSQHSRPEAPAPCGEQAEEDAVQSDLDHGPGALIEMACAEDECLKRDRSGRAAGKCLE